MNSLLNFIERLFRNIKNYFKDFPQETEWEVIPLAKLEVKHMTEGIEKQHHFKSIFAQERAKYLHPFVHSVMMEMIEWVKKEFKFTPVITETVTTLEEDKFLGRKSYTHNECRAFDMRTRDWTKEQIGKFKSHFEEAHGEHGAQNAKGFPMLIVHHDAGHGPHFHVQFDRSFTMEHNLTKGKLG